MSTAIQVGGPLQPGTVDTPLDARVRIDSLDAVASIPVPFVGMIFYAKREGKLYVVKSLKDKQLNHTVVDNAEVKEYEEVGAAVDLSGLDEKYAAKEHTHTADQVTGLDEKFVPLTEGKIPERYQGEYFSDLKDKFGEDGRLQEQFLPEALAETAANPATITLPVPFDENGDNVSLVIDFDENGTFTEEAYTRVTMAEFFSKMKIFNADHYIDLDATGVGKPFYGQSVTFTLDEEMFPGYVAGKTYFARYCWLDSKQGRSEWKGFKFSGDVTDFEPIRLPEVSMLKLHNAASMQDNDPVEIDYRNGEIQTIDNMSGNLTIDTKDVKNIPFGEALILFVENVGTDTKLTVSHKGPGSATVDTNTYPDMATYMIVILNLGGLYVTVSETI